jgi:hypothetical protein
MEAALTAEANKKGFSGKRKDAYIYGAMRKTGWKPAREKSAYDGATALASRG